MSKQNEELDHTPYRPSIEHTVHLLVCKVLGLDDEDHEDDELAKPLEDAFLALITQQNKLLLEKIRSGLPVEKTTPAIGSHRDPWFNGEMEGWSGYRTQILQLLDKLGGGDEPI